MKKKIGLGILGLIVIIAILQAVGIVKPNSTQATQQTTMVTTETEISETKVQESTTALIVETTEEEETLQTHTNVAGDDIDTSAVYEYFNSLLDSSDNPAKWEKIGNEDMDVNSEEWLEVVSEWNQKCEDYDQYARKETAEKFGVTPEEVQAIYLDVFTNNLNEKQDIEILHGELIDSQKVGTNGIVIKVKISPSYSNKATIEQNYFNIEDFVKNQNGNQYDEIQYWAVADMADGSEGKVISFTVNKDMIQAISEGQLVAIQFGEFVDDLYVLPSLLK